MIHRMSALSNILRRFSPSLAQLFAHCSRAHSVIHYLFICARLMCKIPSGKLRLIVTTAFSAGWAEIRAVAS